MKEAAIAAKEKYLEDHPECADIDMKFDPNKLVEECKFLHYLIGTWPLLTHNDVICMLQSFDTKMLRT